MSFDFQGNGDYDQENTGQGIVNLIDNYFVFLYPEKEQIPTQYRGQTIVGRIEKIGAE